MLQLVIKYGYIAINHKAKYLGEKSFSLRARTQSENVKKCGLPGLSGNHSRSSGPQNPGSL